MIHYLRVGDVIKNIDIKDKNNVLNTLMKDMGTIKYNIQCNHVYKI